MAARFFTVVMSDTDEPTAGLYVQQVEAEHAQQAEEFAARHAGLAEAHAAGRLETVSFEGRCHIAAWATT